LQKVGLNTKLFLFRKNVIYNNFTFYLEKKWKKDRRLLTPAFHFQILDDFFEVYNKNAIIFVEQITLQLTNGSEVDLYPMVSRCTLDVITGI